MAGSGRENDPAARARASASARASELVAARAASRRAEAQPEASAGEPEGEPEAAADDARRIGLGAFMRQNKGYILSAAGVIVAVALLIVVAGGLLAGCSGSTETAEEPSYVSPYDWGKLDRTDGRWRYVADGQVMSRVGVDVSDYQGEIDWDAVAADGIEFAIIRVGYRGATEGKVYLDDRYRENFEGARNAGIDCGAYFFSQAVSEEEAVEEADFVLANLDGVPLGYPIAFDAEEGVHGVESPRASGLDRAEMTAIANAFCDRVESAGYRSMVYGNLRDLSRFNYDDLARHDIWWAQYDVPSPTANIDIAMWQYSADGVVDGIETGADMNIDLAEALAYETAS